jgi:TonB family protein
MSPHPSPSRTVILFGLFTAFIPLTLALAQTPPPAPAPKPAALSSYQRMVALWSDIPAYHEILTSKSSGPRKNAALISSFVPTPPFPLPPGKSVSVNVSLAISPTGKVEAARVLDSTDPRFNQAAVDAALRWLFHPAFGEAGPRLSFVVAPMVFVGNADAQPVPPPIHIGIALAPLTQSNIRNPREPQGSFYFTNENAKFVRAARVVITRAEDDAGQSLPFSSRGNFYVTAVGSVSSNDYIRNAPPSLSFSLGEPAATATKVRLLEGVIEFVIPDRDPNATVSIEKVATTLGSPIQSAALAAQGITLVLFDQKAADRFIASQPTLPGGPADYDSGPLFRAPSQTPPTANPSALYTKEKLSTGDLAVGIDDPQGHLVGLEFQTADGQPLHYNHNGWYHSSNSTGKRLDVYAVTLPPDAKMICWLVTERSLQKSAFIFTDIPLPAPRSAAPSALPQSQSRTTSPDALPRPSA